MSTKCHILADGRMITAGGMPEPVEHEFLVLPRIGEKIVIKTYLDTRTFRVIGVTHYAAGVDGDAQTLLAVTSTNGA